MRKSALLLLLASCGHASDAPPAASPRPTAYSATPARATPAPNTRASAAPAPEAPASAAAASAAPRPPVPPLAGEGPRAYVADADGLVEIAAPGGSQVVVPGPIDWCNADARAEVVWFLRGGSLFVFDLVERAEHAIVSGGDGGAGLFAEPPVIAWGDEQLGGESKVDYSVALELTMTSPPRVRASIGCDGDRAYYCYGDTYDPDHPALDEDLAAREQAILATPLVSPAYVAELAARGAKGSLWTRPQAAPKKPRSRPKVAASACDAAPAACGELTPIPGSRLWVVVVGNSRGDFYHEDDALWDPAAGQYVAVRDGELERTREPVANGDLGGLRVSPSGVLSFQGAVFDDRTLYFAPRGDAAISCGWSNGGFRVRGPREGR